MSYKHILVAVDLTQDSKLLVDRAVMIAKATQADVSFIHIDLFYGEDIQRRLVDHDMNANLDRKVVQEYMQKLNELKDGTDYPIKDIFIGSGNMTDEIEQAIKTKDIDLVVCGHHHDFLHSHFSSSGELMKNVDVDLFVVSFK